MCGSRGFRWTLPSENPDIPHGGSGGFQAEHKAWHGAGVQELSLWLLNTGWCRDTLEPRDGVAWLRAQRCGPFSVKVHLWAPGLEGTEMSKEPSLPPASLRWVERGERKGAQPSPWLRG